MTNPKAKFIFTLLAAMMASALFSGATYGQEDTGEVIIEESADDGVEVADTGRSLIDMVKVGGWAMYPLGALSIAGLGLIVYNFIAIRPKKLLNIDVVEQVSEKTKAFQIDEARQICAENPSPLTNICDAGLERVTEDFVDAEAMEKAMEEASVEELSGPFVYINYLSVVASLSPMVGLLGTVSGMVKAFNAIAAQGVGQPQALANNISEALITTATGMIVGIPAMFFFFYFKNKYGKITASVSRIIGDFHHEFVAALRKSQG
ncbi:MotA/TolQ/ExbB proton channel family protein [Puniceicoccus vermicola]|uniref:MotA/TolQ/ExbB proton channel family protein n=1 Tax=Puniceicoccus vermicola TaxID=388746 RepID=A0A7X1E4S4_9BACT|nr:MotA/TolQ/ExbB proton channel family protein [Puniceicoccus vermicola]MBC2602825.1 MotA/TolQ/ExbB proton channel family protein [Puniceicoccus vermicola]